MNKEIKFEKLNLKRKIMNQILTGKNKRRNENTVKVYSYRERKKKI